MNSSPTPSSRTRSPRRSDAWRLGVARTLAAWLAVSATAAMAHGEADDLLPPEPGFSWQAAAALTALDASADLPSRRLRGYVTQAGVGPDRQGLQLEHGTATLAARATPTWGGQVTLGKHGSEAAHVESAWVQWRHDNDRGDTWWTVTAGRQSPAMGALMGQAGHLDRWASMPLAKQLVTEGDWLEEGVQWGWRHETSGSGEPATQWALDAGLWRGRVFPAGQRGPVFPSLHAGWAQGPWQADGWLALLRPQDRGSLNGTLADHTHAMPDCSRLSSAVTCFDGRSRLLGASLVWRGHGTATALPLTLAASGWLRDENGTLRSANGRVAYDGRTLGGWVQALWDWTPHWQTGVRLERAQARQDLQGTGARTLASDLGLLAYHPVARQAVVVSWQPHPQARISAELGREQGAHTATTARSSARFVALRLVVTTP